MKLFLIPILFLTGCITLPEVVPTVINPNKINESNYMKTPCILDGAIVKKKPKVKNINNE